MNKSQLQQIVEEVTARTLVGTISLSVEKIAEEIAKEALSDESFRESLHALVRAASKKIITQLATEQNP